MRIYSWEFVKCINLNFEEVYWPKNLQALRQDSRADLTYIKVGDLIYDHFTVTSDKSPFIQLLVCNQHKCNKYTSKKKALLLLVLILLWPSMVTMEIRNKGLSHI
jgi:hypothetical protein